MNLLDILAYLFELVGLTDDNYDLTQMPIDITVHGFVIDRRMTVKEAITPLMKAYLFDVIEAGGKIKCIPRGGDTVKTINSGELGVVEYGSEPGPSVTVTRPQESEFPTKVKVQYIDKNTDYQVDEQEYELEEEKTFINEVSEKFPIVMTSTQAVQLAEKLMHTSWQQRTNFEVVVNLDHIDLEPADVFVLTGYNILITDINLHLPAFISIKGVSEDQTTYVSDAEPAETEFKGQVVQKDMITLSSEANLPLYF